MVHQEKVKNCDHMRKRQYNTEIEETALESIEETALESTPIYRYTNTDT